MKYLSTLAASALVAFSAGAFTHEADAQTAPTVNGKETVRLCSGAEGKNYEFAAKEIKDRAKGSLNIEVINTGGSWDNLERVSRGECDAAIVQEDAVMQFQRGKNLQIDPLADLYPEDLHLVCGANSGIDELTDLRGAKAHIALGAGNSGPWATWQNIVNSDPAYKDNVPETASGLRAASRVSQNLAQCFLEVSGQRSPSMNEIDQQFGETTHLVEVRDSDLQGIKGMTGKPLYTKSEIMEDTYPNWTPSRTFSDTGVYTVSVMSKFVVDPDKVSEKAQNSLIRAIGQAMPAINERVQAPKP